LQPTNRRRYRVTICSIPKDNWVYTAVSDVADELTRLGCDIVTGGGPGLMQAANEGAKRADPTAIGRSVGIRVDLPFEQDVNAFVTQAYEHRVLHAPASVLLMSDAFIVVPGDWDGPRAMMICAPGPHIEGIR
jgi:predicted Rossmann-fold nucleotide-binding protein